MKKFAVALCAFVLANGSAYAGGLVDPIPDTAIVAIEPVAPEQSLPTWAIPTAIVAAPCRVGRAVQPNKP